MDRNKRRKFGQNFLVNSELIEDIVSDIPFSNGSPVLEIGPGHGALTSILLAEGADLTAVEIDNECIGYLKFHFNKKRLTLIKQDFLNFPIENWLKEHPGACICGNLPYNKGTPILRSILPHLHLSKGIMAMVQLEVAKRICAEPGSKNYGFLTVLIQLYGTATMLRRIEPENFRPRPKVMSATVFIKANKTQKEVPEDFMLFVSAAFSQKRKMLINSLGSIHPKEKVRKALLEIGLSDKIRAESVTVDQFLDLHKLLGFPKL